MGEAIKALLAHHKINMATLAKILGLAPITVLRKVNTNNLRTIFTFLKMFGATLQIVCQDGTIIKVDKNVINAAPDELTDPSRNEAQLKKCWEVRNGKRILQDKGQ